MVDKQCQNFRVFVNDIEYRAELAQKVTIDYHVSHNVSHLFGQLIERQSHACIVRSPG